MQKMEGPIYWYITQINDWKGLTILNLPIMDPNFLVFQLARFEKENGGTEIQERPIINTNCIRESFLELPPSDLITKPLQWWKKVLL